MNPFVVEVGVAICEDRGTACRPVRFRGSTAPDRDKGVLGLDLAATTVPVPSPGLAVQVYDFGAVWCPPCNLLATEILDAPKHAGLLSAWPVERIDVDQSSSWPLKDRYTVGGYPTLVAVDAKGREVARLVGYPGEAATLAWFASLTDTIPTYQLQEGDPAMTGAAASAAARRLAEADQDDAARKYLDRAADDFDLHVARLHLDASPRDAAWLVHNVTSGTLAASWLHPALKADPTLWKEALPLVRALDPADAADMYDLVAGHLGGDAALALRSQAIALLEASFTGDPAHDKAHIGFIAELEAGVGQVDAAVARCAEWSARFPDEFTFDYTASRLLVEASRPADAERLGRSALAKAWGDQKLRAAQPLARAIAAQGRVPEALAVLDDALAAVPAPPEDVQVRTTRYRDAVSQLRAELAKAPPVAGLK
jgi:thiol-disulfide isomerase/thioredoxin